MKFLHTKSVQKLVSIVMVLLATVWQANAAGINIASDFSVEKLLNKKSILESDTGLLDNVKTRALEFYDQAILFSQQINGVAEQYNSLQQKVASGTSRLLELESIIKKGGQPTQTSITASSNNSLESVEKSLLQTEISRNEATAKLREAQTQAISLSNTYRTIQSEIEDRQARIRKINSDLFDTPLSDEPLVLVDARGVALTARKTLRESEVILFQLQKANESLLVRLADYEIAATKLGIEKHNKRLVELRADVYTLRQSIAEDEIARAQSTKESLNGAPAAIQLLVNNSLELAQEYERLVTKERSITGLLDKSQDERDVLIGVFAATQRRVEASGSTSAIGRMLRKRLAGLPRSHLSQIKSEKRQKEINRISDRQIDLDEMRFEQSIDQNSIESTKAALAEVGNVDPQVKAVVEKTLAQRQHLQEKLVVAYTRYLSQITAINTSETELIEVTKEFLAFIQEKLLWIRSTNRLAIDDVGLVPTAANWLFKSEHWESAVEVYKDETALNPLLSLIGMLLFAIALFFRRSIKRKLDAIAKDIVKIRTDKFVFTIQALVYTLLISVSFAAVLASIGLQLNHRELSLDDFATALGNGLVTGAIVLFATNLLRQMCRRNGLADRHFRWSDSVRELLRRQLQWFVPVSTLLTIIVVFTNDTQQSSLTPSIGRPAFLLLMVSTVVFCVKLFRQTGAIAQHNYAVNPRNWITQTRVFWYPGLLFIPLVLSVFSLLGYHHSALYVSYHVLLTLCLILGVFIVKELLLRYLYIDQRKRKFEESVRRRDELQQQRALLEQGGAVEQKTELPLVEDAEVSYEQLSEQAKRLLKTGLLFGVILGVWSIWSDLLPALSFLDGVKLPFSTTELVDGVEKQTQVTLADIGVAILIAFLTFFAAKNLPGVLEITILQHLPMDAGGRYAFTTLSQYSIVALGIFATFIMIGAQWNSVQWLVAALSVGLGFGLQEIFANFISGLIILFERPIRVGDTVTVAEFSGTVSRIRIRATTITDWDNKEIIVPNKNFITERVINWTLTDAITRVIIPIGIGHGSDTELAYRVISETAQSSPLVLDEPKMQLFFLGFGTSTLKFDLRVFVRQLDDRLPATHELYMTINEALKQHGIKIPYEQRDIHIKR